MPQKSPALNGSYILHCRIPAEIEAGIRRTEANLRAQGLAEYGAEPAAVRLLLRLGIQAIEKVEEKKKQKKK